MKFIFLIIFLVFLSSIQSQNDVDAVLQLLDHLRQQSREELNSLLNQWRATQERKSSKLALLNWSLSGQQGQCQYCKADVDSKFEEIRQANAYIDWMITRKLANSQRIDLLQNKLCESQINYIDGVKSFKIFLNIIDYFRKALQNYQLQNEFIQQAPSKTVSEIGKMLKVYNDQEKGRRSIDFLQVMAQIISDDEGDHDDHQLTTTINELFEILDNMESEIKQSIGNSQDNSVQSGVTFSDFKNRIQRENETFDKMILSQKQLIDYLARQLVQLNQRVDKCEAQLKELQTNFDLELAEFAKLKNQYTIALLRLQEELDLFDELYAIYSGKVINQSTDEYRLELQKAIEEAQKHSADDKIQSVENQSNEDIFTNGENTVSSFPDDNPTSSIVADGENLNVNPIEEVNDILQDEESEGIIQETKEDQKTHTEQDDFFNNDINDVEDVNPEIMPTPPTPATNDDDVGIVNEKTDEGDENQQTDLVISSKSGSGCCSDSDTIIVVEDDSEEEEPIKQIAESEELADHQNESYLNETDQGAKCCSDGDNTVVVVEDDSNENDQLNTSSSFVDTSEFFSFVQTKVTDGSQGCCSDSDTVVVVEDDSNEENSSLATSNNNQVQVPEERMPESNQTSEGQCCADSDTVVVVEDNDEEEQSAPATKSQEIPQETVSTVIQSSGGQGCCSDSNTVVVVEDDSEENESEKRIIEPEFQAVPEEKETSETLVIPESHFASKILEPENAGSLEATETIEGQYSRLESENSEIKHEINPDYINEKISKQMRNNNKKMRLIKYMIKKHQKTKIQAQIKSSNNSYQNYQIYPQQMQGDSVDVSRSFLKYINISIG